MLEHSVQQHEAAAMIARSLQIGENIDALFGPGSKESAHYRQITERYRSEWNRLGDNHGLDHPAVAFIGPEGHGKSTLVNLLIGRDPDTSAVHRAAGDRIRWIGPQVPQNLHPQWEESEVVPAENMPDLSGPCLLVDTPGRAWQTECDSFFQTVLSASRFKVLVLKEGKVEAEEWLRVTAACKGSFVLPAVRMDAAETIRYPENHGQLMDRWRTENLPDLVAKLPGVTIEDPIFIPEFRAEGGRTKHADVTRKLLTDGLRRFVEKHRGQEGDRRAELEASWQRFLRALQPIIRDFGDQLAVERSRDLDRAIASLPREIVDSLLADKRPLNAWFRLDARADLMNRISPLAFPFRSLASLLCFTTGSWDRLILATVGSAPSAIITFAGSWRQKKDDFKAASDHQRAPAVFKSVARRRLAEPWSGFMAAMQKAGATVDDRDDPLAGIRITGEDELSEAWVQAKCSASAPVGRWPGFAPGFASWTGTLLFWSLLIGPLVHTYGQYIPASIRSVFGEWTPEVLAAYPMMNASFWFTAVVISLVPCFLTALCLVGWWLRNTRTEAFLRNLKSAMDDHLKQHNAGLRVEATHPQVAAYRNLVGLLMPLDQR